MIYFNTKQKQNWFKEFEVSALLTYISNIEFIYLDTETTGLDPHINKPILLIIGDEHNQYVIDLRTNLKEAIFILKRLATRTFVAHNAKFDTKMMLSINIHITSWICTMVNSLVLYSGIKSYKGKQMRHSLDALLSRHFNIPMAKDIRQYFINKPDDLPFSKVEIEYAAKDIQYLPKLLKRQLQLASQFQLYYLINPYNYNLEGKFIYIIATMEYEGIGFNKDKWLKNATKVKSYLDNVKINLVNEIKTLIPSNPRLGYKRIYNFSSNDDLYYVFESTNEISNLPIREDLEEYREKQLNKILKKREKKAEVSIGTKKNSKVIGHIPLLFNDIEEIEYKLSPKETHSLGEAALNEFLETNPESILYTFVKLLLEYRESSKLFSTYGESFALKNKITDTLFDDYTVNSKNINKITNRIHSNYAQVRTLTGRLSSSGPNMQNIPQTNSLRNCFIPREGYAFMIIDYDRQELVILASQSKDKTLLASINDGLDLHSYLATGSYRIIEDNSELVVSKTENKVYRNNHKPVLFGWIYGAGAHRISKTLNITKLLGQKVKDRLEELLIGAKNYLTKVRNKALKEKEVRCGSKANRRRYFQKNVQEHSLKKQAGNYKMQSTGASMVKEAMVETDKQILRELRIKYPYSYAVMTVHDEATYQLPIELIKEVSPKIADIWIKVGNSYLDGVEITAEWEISNFWKK